MRTYAARYCAHSIICSFIHSFTGAFILYFFLDPFIHSFIYSFICSFIHAVHSPYQQVLLALCSLALVTVAPNRGCCSLLCAKQQLQSRAACLVHTAKPYTFAKHPPCTHPAPILHPPRSHLACIPHTPRTYLAPILHPPRTHPAPTLHPSCTHPAPILHPLRTHPAPTSHPPCTHPASTPHPPQNSKFNPHLLAWCVQAQVDFAADAGVTPSPQSAFVTCASSLTEGVQTSSHADDTRALMTAVLLGGISQDDLTVW